jgi:hypothetical protein
MEKKLATAYTESTWDAMQDGLELILRLFSGPRTLAQLAAEVRSDPAQVESALRRLVRVGLVRTDGKTFEAVASAVHQDRREGMVTSLTRYILPWLTRVARDPSAGFWEQIDVDLTPEEQENTWTNTAMPLFYRLNDLSLDPGPDARVYTAVLVTTSDVPSHRDPADRVLETVKRAARQRATPEAAGRAVLGQFDGLFGAEKLERAKQELRQAIEQYRAREVRQGHPRYTVVLGFFERHGSITEGGGDVV